MASLRRINSDHGFMLNLRQEYSVVGRSANCDLMVENHADVSREHCGLRRYEDDTYTLTDFGSRNGTYINGERVFAETKLKHGDVIKLCADLEFIFEHAPAAADGDATRPHLERQAVLRMGGAPATPATAPAPGPPVAPPPATKSDTNTTAHARRRPLPPEARVEDNRPEAQQLSGAIEDVQEAREHHGFRTIMLDLAEQARRKQTKPRPPKDSGPTPPAKS